MRDASWLACPSIRGERWRTLLIGGLLSMAACVRSIPVASHERHERASSLDSLSGVELYAAGMRFLAASDLTRAEQYLASAMHADFDEHACVRALLETTVRASRLRSAVRYAEPFLMRHPSELALRQLVATLHLVLGELAAAEKELRKVLARSETQAEAHYLLALVLERRGGEISVRRHALQRYLELAPGGKHAEEARAGLLEIDAQGTDPLRGGA
jgi:Flp pilus assembly protein TadD